MKNILIIYHDNCLDGLTSAYICAKALAFNNKIEFVPCNYQSKPPILIGYTDVYILDFSFPLEEMECLLKENPNVNFLLIDHHKTAKELSRLASTSSHAIPRQYSNFTFVFDIEKCGASLTWQYFNPYCYLGCMPNFVRYVQDRDLWKWELIYSEAVSAYLRSLKLTINTIEDYFHILDSSESFNFVVEQGNLIFDQEAIEIKKAIEIVNYISLNNLKIPYVKVDKLASEIIQALYKKESSPYAIGWRIQGEDEIKLDFRSDGNFDVSVVAQQFGGGGHRGASGAIISKQQAIYLGILIE